MTLLNSQFLFFLYLMHIVSFSVAIYDPNTKTSTTTKPPLRREPVLPWYVSKSDSDPTERNTERASQIDDGVKSWSPWRKASGSEIEQRTEIKDSVPSEQQTEFAQFPAFQDYEREGKLAQFDPSQIPPAGNSQYKDSNQQRTFEGNSDRKIEESNGDQYEGVPKDTMKPRKEKILIATKPKETIARFDPTLGVQCPHLEATGQFVYPPDCKFFVNCWKGRAFVQPCAPGTLFNPDTLECDFPHKVQCYVGEQGELFSMDFSRRETAALVSSSNIKPQETSVKLRGEVKCPAYATGPTPHPWDCTKFLQCGGGGTAIMDCGPGTVFNPAISVCDWPRNVKGCEDTLKSPEEHIRNPRPAPLSSGSYDRSRNPKQSSKYERTEAPKKIMCPPNHTGLLPHPDTCKKFLQCADGGTFIMNCGPGTAFNPELQVCDWPYKVPGCSEESKLQRTTARPVTTWRPNYDGFPHGNDRHGGRNELPHVTVRPPYPSRSNPPTDSGFSGNRWENIYAPGTNDEHRPPGDTEDNRDSYGETQFPYPSNTANSHNYPQQPGIRWNPGSSSPSSAGRQTSGYGRGYPVDGTRTDYPELYRQTAEPPYPSPNLLPNMGTNRDDRRISAERNPLPSQRRPGLNIAPDRRTPDFSASFPSSPDGNIYVDSNYEIPDPLASWNQTGNRSNPPYFPNTRPVHPDSFSKNKTTWSQPEVPRRRPNNLEPGRWMPQPGWPPRNQPEVPPSVQSTVGSDDGSYGQQWRTGYPQNTFDRDIDTKMREWASKTNVLVQSKGEVGSGTTAARTMDSTEPNNASENRWQPAYPHGIYVIVNGTRGHYITRELEVNQRPAGNYQPTQTFEPPKTNHDLDSTGSEAHVHQSFLPRPNDNKRPSSSSSFPSPPTANQVTDRPIFRPAPTSRPSIIVQPPPAVLLPPLVPTLLIYSNTANSTVNQQTQSPLQLRQQFPVPTERPTHILDSTSSSPTEPVENTRMPSLHDRTMITRIPRLKPPVRENDICRDVTGKLINCTYTIIDDSESIETASNNKKQKKWKDKIGNETNSFGEPNKASDSKSSEILTLDPEVEEYGVELLAGKEVWKPTLVFENKTKVVSEDNDKSVIMKINKKTTDVEIFGVGAAPLQQQEEPPFPVYYIPPVRPLSEAQKAGPPTPISGQVIRLRGGSGPHDGYLEVQGAQPGWGVICDLRNSWTLREAHVVCRQLGYSRGAEMAWQGRNNRKSVPSWIAANSVTCHGNETRFQSCKFTHGEKCRVERDAVGVRCLKNPIAYCRKDETPHEGQCYHLAKPNASSSHDDAIEYCAQRNARLVDISDQAENNFLSEWLLQAHPDVDFVMTSGVGLTTLNRTIWMWGDSSHTMFRFNKWWPGWSQENGSPVLSKPSCIVMKKKFPCHGRTDKTCITDYFFWEPEDCMASETINTYVCERPYDDIGCVYGKGSHYVGTANVTSSGKECLHWSDKRVEHPLIVNVVSRELREKLRGHNYCRNPNPDRESRPWCFTGPYGEREYCDIPPCGKIGFAKKSVLTGGCKPKHFECLPGECIPSPWVCDGEEDCTNGADERHCSTHINAFVKSVRRRLQGYDVEKWLNTPLKTCALRCKEADFTCRSFAHSAESNVCLLSDSNVGMTGALVPSTEYDYYEMKERSLDCTDMFVCRNGKCINQTEVCNGKNDCNDRTDENACSPESLDYGIRLAGANNSHEGRVEVKVFGHWGQVCDDGFGMINAHVICKELGFPLGALKVVSGGFYGNLEPPDRFMVDQLKCRGNESSLRECDFEGWGVHNCQPEEAVGIACKTGIDTCPEGYWKCDSTPECIKPWFICDSVPDCRDKSDESPTHCDVPFDIRLVNGSSPLEGRVEVRHHSVWGTVCDDDFTNATAAVICRSLGYYGTAIAKKNGYFGPGEGPIWLDEVVCLGNETQLYRCEHNPWGHHNCDHSEDAGVICTPGDANEPESSWNVLPELPEVSVNELLPAECGKRSEDFNDDEDLIFEKVVRGSIARKGSYPWQASIRIRGHSRSSHWCGAVILSPLHVLTAAHCLSGYKGNYFVRAGDYDTEVDEGTEVEANIEDYYVHEDFRQGHRMNNDIALVLLKGRGIPLGKDIMPICLPDEDTEYYSGMNCTISGFGSFEYGQKTQSRSLRYGWIPLLDQAICRADYVYGDSAITDGMVCAGYLDESVDTCDGDSGGPLACHRDGSFTLYGITSWGGNCGRVNKPGVYVRVSYYRRWIEQKIRESLTGR